MHAVLRFSHIEQEMSRRSRKFASMRHLLSPSIQPYLKNCRIWSAVTSDAFRFSVAEQQLISYSLYDLNQSRSFI